MRILVVSNGWGVNTIAGGEYHILRVISYWSNNNDIHLIIPKSGYEVSKKIISEKCKIHFSSKEQSIKNLKTNVFYYLRRIITSIFVKTDSPDIVIAASHLFYDVFPAYILSKRYKSKLVIYNHSIIIKTRRITDGFYNLLSLINEKLGIMISKKADAIFTVNDDTRKYLLEKNFKKEKIFETDNGVEKHFISSIPNVKKEYEGCYCGRTSKKKGVFDILKVWGKIVTSIPNAKFSIIGDGPDFNQLKKAIEENNLSNNIDLKGFLLGKEKIEAIKSAKIFLFPSYEEGWGIAISEGLLCGLVPVCYNLEAYDIFGDAILKVKVGDTDEMSRVTLELLTNENKLRDFINKGMKAMEGFKEWDRIAEDQSKALTSIIKGS